MSLAITISKSLFTSSFNMKLFLKHILVFSVIFFFAEKSIWFILNETPNKEYDKRLEKLLKGQVNKDVIVLGSSKGAGNILAGQLQSKTNFSCYNLSYQGSNVNFHYFILKTLLKYMVSVLSSLFSKDFTGTNHLRNMLLADNTKLSFK